MDSAPLLDLGDDAASAAPPVGPRITVRTGSGTGRTRLSAFDAALRAAGVADLNLVTLSSVVPPGSTVVESHEPLAHTHGDRLWCVLASAGAEQHGEVVWAGLGWARETRGGAGVFVEHHSGSEEALRTQIALSLEDLCASRGWTAVESHTVVASAECVSDPVCALAVAAYEVQGWGTGG
ncbi:pyruvoyl-dependent arginine decarboxylase [Nocardioides dokdonensis FR1436]|uniref:Pyruvoyl-dependent arginine decarboxylase AaxB n=1 Tax=Nocardioides dokdonensis FR1436 TaxID=1300347 RepID=A0A1A9GK22_9ACTN|nr:pyruvoyl-dependent arginine decarboxylase [Nocardioides dokdonensis]ANH38639.1 pyruvoyl-dependent arginine decarboxylase [Nocardioides dokdonensis FR1436]